jgi:hypothetical protein
LNFTATDKAGNKAVLSIKYYVQYNFSGALYLTRKDGSMIFKAGETIPVRFWLKDAKGPYVTDAVAKLYIAEIIDGKAGPEFEAASTSSASKDNIFRYDGTDNQYIFNLSTKNLKAGVYQLRIELGDGSINTVIINLR